MPSGSPYYWLRCRRLATSTPETIRSESAMSVGEAAAVVTEAVKDTARQVGATVSAALDWTPWVLGAAALGVGLLAVSWVGGWTRSVAR